MDKTAMSENGGATHQISNLINQADQSAPAGTLTGSRLLQAQRDQDVIAKMLPLSRSMQCQKDQEIMLRGTKSRYLYYVEKGVIEVSYTVSGTKITVALIGPGNFFGEIGFFDEITRVRDIRATDDATIRFFDHQTLEDLQQHDPVLYGQFMTVMARTICGKFRRVMEEREPLTAFAAALSTRRQSYQVSRPLPKSFFQTTEWRTVNRKVEEFKAQLYDLSYSLQEDVGPEIAPGHRSQCHRVLNEFNDEVRQMRQFEENTDASAYVWGYVFKEVFPYFMRSRFAERTYYKPKGYAGDFMMMEMIYRQEPEGDGKLGTLIDEWFLNRIPARAVRGRRQLLGDQLEKLAQDKHRTGRNIKIMNLACGPCRELFDFIQRCDFSEAIEATCVDIDSQALQYTNQHVNIFPHRASIRFMNENLVKWSLGRVGHNFGLQDIIYSAGLTDYLNKNLFLALMNRCYEQLKPEGRLIIGNFGPTNPDRVFMDHILHWRLIHRHADELRELFSQTPFGHRIKIISEEQGVNLFAIATKL